MEQRLLLDANDPVIVLTEAFSLTTFANVTSQTVHPRLWKNPGEFPWDLDLFNWNADDGDGNGYPDDAYGWNFRDGPGGSPNIIRNGPAGGHGAAIMGKVLDALTTAGSQGDRIRIMHVIGSGAQIAQYVVAEKAKGVNIVAVSHSTPGGSLRRADAEMLRDRGILLFVGSGNAGSNSDQEPVAPPSPSFYHATPRFGIQQPAVHTIIPATTDPGLGQSDYGINSFYFAAPGAEAQSYTSPIAAAYAAIAVEAYQEAHQGATPSAHQIKRAMMSGVQYLPSLDRRTITHDYAEGARRDGGLLSLSDMIASINQTMPEITNVSMTQVAVDPFGTKVSFALNSLGADVSNWTISWGDNSGSDRSGVEVLPGELELAQHTFPFENVPHHYFPTIYAMSGTKQVYLPAPSAQAEVVITTPFVPTSGQDHYTLTRSGANTVLTLQNSSGPVVSHSFAPGELPTCSLTLGQGQDILTVDFSNGNPLASTALDVTGLPETGVLVRVIGTAGDDSISVSNGTLVNVNGTQFPITVNLSVFVDARGGDDEVSAVAGACTLIGGAGNDSLHLPFAALFPYVVDGGADTDLDTLTGLAGPDANVSDVEYFVETQTGNITLANRYNAANVLLFGVVRQPGGHTVFNLQQALSAVVVDAFGTMTYGLNQETIPVGPVTSLRVEGADTDEQFDIDANVAVTLNAGGGLDSITVTAPGATINAQAGDDVIAIHDEFPSGLTINGGPGRDSVIVDSGSSTGEVSLDLAQDLEQLLVNPDNHGDARVRLMTSQSFDQLTIGTGGGVRMVPDGNLLLRVEATTIDPGGFLDLADNDMIVDLMGYGSVEALLKSGYNGGPWNGSGIRSTSAANATTRALGIAIASDLGVLSFLGQSVGPNSVLIRYTFYGDANLSGNVNLADFNRLAANFGQTSRRWVHGDFNFDGTLNLADFNRLASNFGATDGPAVGERYTDEEPDKMPEEYPN